MVSVIASTGNIQQLGCYAPAQLSFLVNRVVCVVCEEDASGTYFGAVVCLPCKSFFIRCTKEGLPKFTCLLNGRCDVTHSNRLRCQACRFRKCLLVGMCRKEKPESIEPEEGQELCLVCADIANGIHFGVPTCEGCKKFFRRALKESAVYFCKFTRTCILNPRNRNTCRYCRYHKCIAVGMSRNAIRMGRPKKYRPRCLEEPEMKGSPVGVVRTLPGYIRKTYAGQGSSQGYMHMACPPQDSCLTYLHDIQPASDRPRDPYGNAMEDRHMVSNRSCRFASENWSNSAYPYYTKLENSTSCKPPSPLSDCRIIGPQAKNCRYIHTVPHSFETSGRYYDRPDHCHQPQNPTSVWNSPAQPGSSLSGCSEKSASGTSLSLEQNTPAQPGCCLSGSSEERESGTSLGLGQNTAAQPGCCLGQNTPAQPGCCLSGPREERQSGPSQGLGQNTAAQSGCCLASPREERESETSLSLEEEFDQFLEVFTSNKDKELKATASVISHDEYQRMVHNPTDATITMTTRIYATATASVLVPWTTDPPKSLEPEMEPQESDTFSRPECVGPESVYCDGEKSSSAPFQARVGVCIMGDDNAICYQCGQKSSNATFGHYITCDATPVDDPICQVLDRNTSRGTLTNETSSYYRPSVIGYTGGSDAKLFI